MTMTITELLYNKEIRYQVFFSINGNTGEEKCILNGEEMSFDDIKNQYPIIPALRSSNPNKEKGQNPDSTSLA